MYKYCKNFVKEANPLKTTKTDVNKMKNKEWHIILKGLRQSIQDVLNLHTLWTISKVFQRVLVVKNKKVGAEHGGRNITRNTTIYSTYFTQNRETLQELQRKDPPAPMTHPNTATQEYNS